MRTVALIEPRGRSERLLREREDVVPEPCLEMGLQLRQVEVWPPAALEQFLGVPERVQPEVDQRPGRRPRRRRGVLLGQMPAAGANDEHGRFLVQPVRLLSDVERDRAAHRVEAVRLPLDHVRPGRRARVLEIGHEHPRARVQRVDHHLPLDRAGDLAAPVQQSAGTGSTRQSASRTACVANRKPGVSPATIRA